jgi:hypothetical protein
LCDKNNLDRKIYLGIADRGHGKFDRIERGALGIEGFVTVIDTVEHVLII